MSPILLNNAEINRRHLGHDMESFFAVIIWMASFEYDDEAAFMAKPLARGLLEGGVHFHHIAGIKKGWFHTPDFSTELVAHFTPAYRENTGFVELTFSLLDILYPPRPSRRNREVGGGEVGAGDEAKEGLFRRCMKEMDDFLGEARGIQEMTWIDSNSLRQDTYVSDSPGPGASEVN